MKSKTFTRITKVLLLAVLFLFVGVRGWGQAIVNFPLDLTYTNTPAEFSTGNDGCRIGTNATGTVVYDDNTGATVTGWNNGNGTKSWGTTSFNTTDYVSISFSTYIKSSSTGPRDFSIQFSTDNTNWTTVSNITANSLLTNTGTIDLTDACSNKPTLFLRIVMSSNISVNGGTVDASGQSTIMAFVINGTPPVAPSTQASNIAFIAITPTTIKVSWSNGTGDNRILKMNIPKVFSTPTDNVTYTANNNYSGSGEQIVYNGNGNVTTITVPNSSTAYYFRVYEYKYNDGMTRYKTNEAVKNPRQCKLETIHTPTHANILLTTATLGGTITTPLSGIVSYRGIYWSPTPGVDENSTKVEESSIAGGTFTMNITDLPRSSTIYYKAYVTNGTGTIMTNESSFDNIPEFSGDGTWDEDSKWDVLQAPGSGFTYGNALDKPIINGTCTLNSNTTVTDLTINTSKQLNISPDFGVTVSGSITNNGGTAGLKLLSTAAGTGSLMHNTANVNATVQRYISGTNNDLTAKAYHLVSVPINSATYLSGVWLDSYLFTYLEGSNTWFNWDDPTGNVLNTPEGAMVYYKFGASKTYSITGQLNNGSYSPTVTYSGSGKGYNLVPNPYPSAINWEAASGWTTSNISGTIWGFNPTNKVYGAWNGSTGTESVTNIIPVGQAFFVVANGASPSLSMDNNVRLHDTKDFLKSGGTVPDVLHIIAAGNEGQNEIAIQFADNATINGSDDLDAVKFYSDMTVPQFSSFTSSDPSLLTINAIPYSDESAIVPLRFDMDFTGEITFTASGMESFENNSSIKLEDKQLAQLVDLRQNPVYTFNHTPTDSPERFALHFGGVLGLENPVTEKLSTITVSGSTIYLNYPASNASIYATLFDVQGRLIKQVQISNAGQDNLSISTDGIYILKLSLPSGTETHKIVVR